MARGSARVVLGCLLIVSTIALVLAICGDWLPWLRGPAPFPVEWQWEYAPKSTTARGGSALLCVLALCGLLALTGSRWAACRARWLVPFLLIAGAFLGWGVQLGLLQLEHGGAVQTLVHRTLDPIFTSHYAVAGSPMAEDPGRFLDRHAELLRSFREGAPHAATHPPGPVLYYRAAIAACESTPRLSRWLQQLMDPHDAELGRVVPPLPPDRLAAALLGAGLLGLLCAAACWPTASLAKSLGAAPMTAVRLGLLWNLLPGPVLMAPEIDQALALPVMGGVAVLSLAVNRGASAAGAVGRGMAAGMLSGIALLMSYGAGAFLLIGFVAVLASAGRPAGKRVLVAVAAAVLVTGGVVALPALAGHDVLNAARTALAIHREVYTQSRDYLSWLLFNAIDLVVFAGLPVVLLGAWRAGRAFFAPGPARAVAPTPRSANGVSLLRFQRTIAAALAVLLLSGAVRGEIGRIGIPLMPLLLIAALLSGRREKSDHQTAFADTTRPPADQPSAALAVLVAVLLAALCFAIRLSWRVP